MQWYVAKVCCLLTFYMFGMPARCLEVLDAFFSKVLQRKWQAMEVLRECVI